MADVFVSYARSDRARVAPIVAAIEAQGLTVWWDPAIEPGQEFDRQIEAELKTAAAVLVVWTPNSVESRWVRGEARDAAARGILVPVRFDGASLPIDVRALHTTDFDDWGEDAKSSSAQEMLRALGAMIARRRAAPAARAARPAARISIAVLPFANLTGDASRDYLGDGLAEELIHVLARVPGLRVPSRTSSFAYRRRDIDLRRIATELEVGAVLEGSIRAAGERIRITAQLIDGESGFHLWSQHFDRRAEDLFELQDELASAIILQTLNVAEQGAEQGRSLRGPPTRSLEAYQLYLAAAADIGTGFKARSAFEKLQSAVRLDPGFAKAQAFMAHVRTMGYVFGIPLPGTLADAEQQALQALDADPDSAAAHGALGVIRTAQARWVEAEASFQRSLTLDPTEPDAWARHATYVLASTGHLRAMIASAREAVRLAPPHPVYNMQLMAAYLLVGNDIESRKYGHAAIDLGIQRTMAPLVDVMSQLELRAGRHDAACALIQESLAATPGASRDAEAMDLVFGGLAGTRERSAAITALDALRADGLTTQPPIMRRRMILWYSMLEAYDEAYEVMHRGLDDFAATGTIGVAWGYLWLKEFAGFRADPRFGALATRMKLPDYWAVHGPPDGYDWHDGRLLVR